MKRTITLTLGFAVLLLLIAVTAHACRGRFVQRRIVTPRREVIVTRTVRRTAPRRPLLQRPLLRRPLLQRRRVQVVTVAQPRTADAGVARPGSDGPPATIDGRVATDDDVIDLDANEGNAEISVPSEVAPPAAHDTVPVAPEPVESATRSTREMRLWTDASGQHRIRARLASAEGDNVYLDTEDGRHMRIAISNLSRQDQERVRQQRLQQVSWNSAD